jgi:hypothetical protein
VPWLIRVGHNDVPSYVGVYAKEIKVPWLIKAGNNNVPSDVGVLTELIIIPVFMWMLFHVIEPAHLFSHFFNFLSSDFKN